MLARFLSKGDINAETGLEASTRMVSPLIPWFIRFGWISSYPLTRCILLEDGRGKP